MTAFQPSCDSVLSLFSGAGGLSLGFSMAGLKPVCAIELDHDASETYRNNIGSPCHELNLGEVNPEHVKSLIGNKQPFAIIGGPPCQGFSTAGSRRLDDPRNRLIFNYLKIVETVRPRWFLFENVEGLLTSDNGSAVVNLVSEFLRIGYTVRLEKVNFAAFGIPQTRKRIIIIGNLMGIDFNFPSETHSYSSGKSKKINQNPFAPTLDEALMGLGIPINDKESLVTYDSFQAHNAYDSLMRFENSKNTVTLHYHSTTEQEIEKFILLNPGQTMKDLPENLQHDSFKKRAFRRVMDGTPTGNRGGAPSGIKRLHGDLNCLTITGAATREFIHPHENRTLTLRECARIQSFQDKFEFSGNYASIAQQIGNAVPQLAASGFARHLKEIDGRFGGYARPTHSKTPPRLLDFVLTEASAMSPSLQLTYKRLTSFMQGELAF